MVKLKSVEIFDQDVKGLLGKKKDIENDFLFIVYFIKYNAWSKPGNKKLRQIRIPENSVAFHQSL